MFRCPGCWLAVAAVLAAALCARAGAQDAEPVLRCRARSRGRSPPTRSASACRRSASPVRGRRRQDPPASVATRRAVPARRPARGHASRVEASGRVELRTRPRRCWPTGSPTTSRAERGPRQGQRDAAAGQRLGLGPGALLQARQRDRLLRGPALLGRARSARGAMPIDSPSSAPTDTTSCGARDHLRRAAGRLVPARRVDRARHGEEGRRRARCAARLHGRIRCSTRRGSSSRSPTSASPASSHRSSGQSGTRGFDMAVPYYFNLAPNYDATLIPRIMTKRGLQLGGQFRYMFDTISTSHRPARASSTPSTCPTTARTAPRAGWLSWRHNQQFTPWLAGYVNFNQVSDDTYFADLAERVPSRRSPRWRRKSGFTGHVGPLSCSRGCRASRRCRTPTRRSPPPYDRLPQVLATLAEVRWHELLVLGLRRSDALLPRNGLAEGGRARAVPAAWSGGGRRPGWFVAARGARARAALRPRRPAHAARRPHPERRGAHREPRRAD